MITSYTLQLLEQTREAKIYRMKQKRDMLIEQLKMLQRQQQKLLDQMEDRERLKVERILMQIPDKPSTSYITYEAPTAEVQTSEVQASEAYDDDEMPF